MSRKIKIAAFGALNEDSYSMFSFCLEDTAQAHGLQYQLLYAGPYPNKEAISVPGRPLRGDALKDPALAQDLYKAVAGDARALGGDFNYYCMPCMSMIGFHDGIEKELGQRIVRLSDALVDFYKDVDRIGVLHMRPAAKRVQEMFGARAITPDEDQAARLLAAEGNAAAIEKIMLEITLQWRDAGLSHVLFARADAPLAARHLAPQISGIQVNSYFDILAGFIAARASA